jgi:hypothetical protein
MRASGISFAAAILSTGCANSPSISVLGAYFPDWLFCIVAGVTAAVVFYLASTRSQYSQWLKPAAVVYPTLAAFLALVAWLIFFNIDLTG